MRGEELLVVDVEPNEDAFRGCLEVSALEKRSELGAVNISERKVQEF